MLIGSQFKLSQINSDFTVKVNNTPLERVIKYKSLGVQIDESLNWCPHINSISKKISAGIALLKRVSHFIPFDTRVNMYKALVMPYFNYCSAVWGSIDKELADKRLINLQKRVIRIVSRSSFDAHTNPIFVSLRILKFEDIIKLQIGKVMYLYKNGLLPVSFNDMFLLNCDIHSYNTRNKNSFRLPYCRTNVRKFSLRFQGPKIFNSLSSEIQNASSSLLNSSHFFLV